MAAACNVTALIDEDSPRLKGRRWIYFSWGVSPKVSRRVAFKPCLDPSLRQPRTVDAASSHR